MAEMSEYNGYSGEVRGRSGYWQKAAYLMGLRPKPSKCAACGQDQGIISGHWETYDEPFALNEDIPLCSTCHLFVHSRNRYRDKYAAYCENVAQGLTAAVVMTKFDWMGFKKRWLDGVGDYVPSPNPGDPGLLVRIGTGEELARIRAEREDSTPTT